MATYSTHSKTGHASADPRHCTLFLKSAATSLANPEALDEQSACQQDSPEDNPNNRPRPSSVVTFSIKMPWFSILPAHFTVFETWIIRFFLLLGTVTIGPWLLVLTYDLVLYIFRALAYDIPFIGSRARGSQRPRAPSFAERLSGRARTFSIPGIGSTGSEDEEGVRWRSRDANSQVDSGRAAED